MRVVPYNLNNSQGNSDGYYLCIKSYTSKVEKKTYEICGGLIDKYKTYLKELGIVPTRSDGELIIEVLTLGVLWKVYGYRCMSLRPIYRSPLIKLSQIRRHTPRLKLLIDTIRGGLMTLALTYRNHKKQGNSNPSIKLIDGMLLWLTAFGDFEQEVTRLRVLTTFLDTIVQEDRFNYLEALMRLTDWFQVSSQDALGQYTQNVDGFIMKKQKEYRWREDIIFSTRKPIEYHLNMVGAEILSRAYHHDFINSPNKKVLLPVCMRGHYGVRCKAVSKSFGLVCVGCMSDCTVNKITTKVTNQGHEVYMIPHESAAFVHKDDSGIVGVSCVTRLIEGGWKAKEMGFSPKCVLLDYCGCQHWDKNAIPTTINMSELDNILQDRKV